MTESRLKPLARSVERAPIGLSKQGPIKTALAEYPDREEQALREREEDEARWRRYQETGEAIDQEPVLTWLDALAQGHDETCPTA
jgi:predicted transcriptional regulator